MTAKKEAAKTPKPATLRIALAPTVAAEFNRVRTVTGISDAKLRGLVASSADAHLRGKIGSLVLADISSALDGS